MWRALYRFSFNTIISDAGENDLPETRMLKLSGDNTLRETFGRIVKGWSLGDWSDRPPDIPHRFNICLKCFIIE
jgi:hypothetical protein